MSFLLDTNAVSEWAKPRPNSGLIAWFESADEDRLFLSVVTIIELRGGIERMPAGALRSRIESWLVNDLLQRFEGRLLGIDLATADFCGRLIARGLKIGRPLSAMDALIAATAQTYEFTLVTRNLADFDATGTRLLNPWKT